MRTECCMRRFLRQIAKYSHEREGKKRRQNPLIQQMIVTKYVNIFLTLNMKLENRFILIAGFAGSCLRHCHINIYRDPKLGQVGLFASGLSDAIMLELFKETPNDVTYTLMELENIY